MATAVIDDRLKYHIFFWYGIIGLTALMLGYFLAADVATILLMVSGVAWLTLLPYHASIALYLAMGTFNSALILPFLPGRPYVWEFAAVLAWTGVIITISLRRFRPDFPQLFREARWMFAASVGYSVVLVVTMFFRGFGLRILGSEQVGGRLYFQQLLCIVFPLLFIMLRVNEKTLTRLFVIQCLLSSTYLVSDFVFSIAPMKLLVLLDFFELPNDALNFEMQSMRFGIRRFQSLAAFSQGMIYFLLVFFSLRDFVSRRGFIMLPVLVGTFAMGLLSGHRWVVVIVAIAIVFCAYAQRFFSVRNLIIGFVVGLLAMTFMYGYADRLPTAFQRSVSFMPGLRIDNQAYTDAASTMWARKVLFRIGIEMIPQYLLVGRGFARYVDDYSGFWDPTTISFHINQGKFYNGVIGLLVNTGFFGAACMMVFMYVGSKVAWNIIRHLRQHGCHDNFARVCSIVSSLWMANVLAFLFLHGDSEFAMKTFSLQAGVLMVCHSQLTARSKAAAPQA